MEGNLNLHNPSWAGLFFRFGTFITTTIYSHIFESTNTMEQILSLYKSTENNLSSPIIIDLIKRATSNKKIFGYAEIYEPIHTRQPSLELSAQACSWINILRIFTYGRWNDYKEMLNNSMDETFPDLTEAQTTKLKQLSLLSLCASSDVVPYQEIQQALDLSAEELEPLVIDTIYSGNLTAKLDTQNQTIEVARVAGRDVDADRLNEICSILDQWEEKTSAIVNNTQQHIEQTRSDKSNRAQELESYNQKITKTSSTD